MNAQVTEPTRSVRSVAFYLPQFHPVPENDQWWGDGFTEWTNVRRAVPRFDGHRQPQVPTELGYYDLRDADVRERQAELAAGHRIEAFCYYHYWFNGRRLLERPFDEVLRSGSPKLPFVLCWANENWTRTWSGSEREILVSQRYGDQDDLCHIRWLAGAFSDPRYLRVDGRPLFLVYQAKDLPDPRRTTDAWRAEAARLGVGELFLARVESFPDEAGDPAALGFDAAVAFAPNWRALRGTFGQRSRRAARAALGGGRGIQRVDYSDVVAAARAADAAKYRRFPCVAPSWDNTPRRTSGALVVEGANPAAYGDWVRSTIEAERPDLLFVNAWNEWGEGAHLEPCEAWGRGYLEAHRDAVTACESLVP